MLKPNRRDLLRAFVAAPAGMSLMIGQTNTPIHTTKLTDRIAVISGDGGNMAVLISGDGLMLIDGGYAERAAELMKAIGEIDPHKITLYFNTHWHLDHVGCNEMLGAAGTKIMAHENVKKRVSERIVMEALNRTIEPLKPAGWPNAVFTAAGKIQFGHDAVDYTPVPPAHTDGDSYLFFPEANILHTGDLLFNGTYPLIDYSTGGWIGGTVAAQDRMLKVGDAKTRVIPGHGPVASKDDLKAGRDMLATVHERLEKFRKDGASAKDVVAAAPTKDFDARFGKGMKPDQFVEIAYTGLLRHA